MIVNRYVGEVKTGPGEFGKMKIWSPLLAAEMLRQAETETLPAANGQTDTQSDVR